MLRPLDLLGDLGGFALGLDVVGLELGLHAVDTWRGSSAVARSALPRFEQEVAGKPVLTRTTSPIWPSLATRSSKNDFHFDSPLDV